MWFAKSRSVRRSRPTEAERSWLGAEAFPGGALPRAAPDPGAREAAADVPDAPDAPDAPATGPSAWLATALRWTRRGRAT